MQPRSIDDVAAHWHERAAQMRVLADMASNDEAKVIMLHLADDYDKLGDRATDRKPVRQQ
jgi:hypothetical protein